MELRAKKQEIQDDQKWTIFISRRLSPIISIRLEHPLLKQDSKSLAKS